MTTAAIFTAAHATARLADKMVAYRTRFTTALRAAWATAKQTINTVMEQVIEHHTGRVLLPYAEANAAAELVAKEVEVLLAKRGRSSWAQFRTLRYDCLAGKLDIGTGILRAVYTAEEVVANLAMEMGCYAGYGASAAEIAENA